MLRPLMKSKRKESHRERNKPTFLPFWGQPCPGDRCQRNCSPCYGITASSADAYGCCHFYDRILSGPPSPGSEAVKFSLSSPGTVPKNKSPQPSTFRPLGSNSSPPLPPCLLKVAFIGSRINYIL